MSAPKGPADGASGVRPIRIIPAPEAPPWGDDEPPHDGRPKPVIRIGVDVHRVLEELDRELGPADPLLFRRAHELVTVTGADERSKLAKGTPVLRPLTTTGLLPHVTRHVQFVALVQPKLSAIRLAEAQGQSTEPELRKISPPAMILASFRDSPDLWPNVRPLLGVSESPLLRADGTICQTAGYDTESGYLYSPSCDYPRVIDNPSRDDARRALAELVDVFADFPYADEPSRYVPVAAILAILARPAIEGSVPALLFDASVHGSGKTLQCDVAHAIATGRIPAHANWPIKDEEQEKLLSSYALSSPQAIVLDNVKGLLGGSALEQVLTTTSVEFRMLGGLELRRLPWHSVLLVSGNNVNLTEDMLRRTLLSRLESPLERPQDRTDFVHSDLLAWTLGGRARLVSLALTVLRAYAAYGWPDTGVRMASFQPFARVVAGSIRFADGPDVIMARPPEERAGMDSAQAARVIIDRWHTVAVCALGPATLKQLLSSLYPAPGKHDPPDGHDDLREAIELLAQHRGTTPSARELGKRLTAHVGRWFGNRRLRVWRGEAGIMRYVVDSR